MRWVRFGLWFFLAWTTLVPCQFSVAAEQQAGEGAPERERVRSPRPLTETYVEYPSGAHGDEEVLLELVVGRNGAVDEVRVVLGEEPFASAAQQAALGWIFVPGERNGVPIAGRIRFLVRFEEPRPEADRDEALIVPEVPAPEALVSAEPPLVDVTVQGERGFAVERISRAEAKQLPGAFGNPLRAIESLPGVTPTLSGAPYFYVRGAPPGNLGYFLDGIRLPALFHVLAGPSVVHPALIDEVEFYPGPYPARYGRFAGGIAAGLLRPVEHELHGEVSSRAFDSSGLVELPLTRDTSLTASGRFSYANPIARWFAPDISVRYWDYQTKLDHDLSSVDHLQLFGFGSLDDLSRREDERQIPIFGSEFHRVQLAYRRDLDDGWLRTATLIGWDRSAQEEGRARLTDTLTRTHVELEHGVGETTRLRTGVDVGHDRYTLQADELEDPEVARDYLLRFPARVDSVAGLYASLLWRASRRISLTTGVRSDVYSSRNQVAIAVSPRLAGEFEMGRGLTVLHALGLADQPPSNPFPQPGANPTLGQGLQRALQSSAGVRWRTSEGLSVQTTLFQTASFQLSDGPGISRIDNDAEGVNEQSRSTGSSRGLELLVRRDAGRFRGYLAYTLAYSQRSVGRAEGPSLFDRRHVASGAFSSEFGAGYSAGLRGTFYTGIPADVAYLEAAKNPPRTPPFYRVDVRAEKRWRLGSRGAYWAVVLEMLNTTLQKEVLGMSCNAYVCRENAVGPVAIPSLGLESVF